MHSELKVLLFSENEYAKDGLIKALERYKLPSDLSISDGMDYVYIQNNEVDVRFVLILGKDALRSRKILLTFLRLCRKVREKCLVFFVGPCDSQHVFELWGHIIGCPYRFFPRDVSFNLLKRCLRHYYITDQLLDSVRNDNSTTTLLNGRIVLLYQLLNGVDILHFSKRLNTPLNELMHHLSRWAKKLGVTRGFLHNSSKKNEL